MGPWPRQPPRMSRIRPCLEDHHPRNLLHFILINNTITFFTQLLEVFHQPAQL
jgi:hypothetical protein